MNALDDTGHEAHGGGSLRPLYPKSIAYLIEERHLLWYEDPEEYDTLLREFFVELKPAGTLNCIFVKNAMDCMWEFRRMRKMKQAAINSAMPYAATKLLTSSAGLWGDPDEPKVQKQAEAIAFGAGNGEDGEGFTDRMHAKRVTSEMIHYKALNSVAEELHWINQECARIENRFHYLVREYEKRNATLAAMAKSLVERERAEVVEFREVN